MNRPGRLLFGAAVVGAVVGVVAWLISASTHTVRPWLVILLFVSLALLVAIAAQAQTLAGTGTHTRAEEVAAVVTRRTDRERGGLALLEGRIEQAMRDPDRFEAALRPRLRDLIEHRLRTKYGLSAQTDPESARQIVGESLWPVMSPISFLPTPRQLTDWVARIESL